MTGEQIERTTTHCQQMNTRYVIKAAKYEKQYNQIYLKRLAETRDALSVRAKDKWGNEAQILDKIIDSEIKAHDNDVVLIGTIFKEMHLRNSVLKDFKDNTGVSGAVQSVSNISSVRDSLIIEDNSGRAALGGEAFSKLASTLVSGVGVAVKGGVEGGIFVVNDWLFAHDVNTLSTSTDGSAAAATATATSGDSAGSCDGGNDSSKDKYLLFVSGIQMGALQTDEPTADGSNACSELSQQMLVDFVSGRLGDENDVKLASKIVKVIVAGNSVKPADPLTSKERYSSTKNIRSAVAPSKQLDILLSQVLTSCPLDLMPGATDPATMSFPQQPMHQCLFPHSTRFNSFSRVTNPYEATFDDLLVMGTSGQPITDIARQTILPKGTTKEALDLLKAEKESALAAASMDVVYNDGDEDADTQSQSDPLLTPTAVAETDRLTDSDATDNACIDILRNTLQWGHLCPTAPDTLACYPFQDRDPFIIPSHNIPHILFAGNQPMFATSLVEIDTTGSDNNNHNNKKAHKTRLVCIPAFKDTATAVLVNIGREDFECTTIEFH